MLYRTGGPGGPLQQSLGNVTSFTDNGLQNGTTYSYRVSASNAVGEGPQSNEASAMPVAPATVPSAPQNLQATAGVAQVSLGWSPPADGGSALTGYMLYRTGGPGGPLQQSLGNVTSFTDNGLQNGTTYSYRVSASNAVGEGPQSNEASAMPVAPATVPSAPQNLQATAGVAQVSLGWSPPADGGSALTGDMLYRTGGPGGPLQQSLGNVTSFTDNGLQNGTTYSYRVSASNAVGEGPQSNEASAMPVAPATVPSAPQNLQATAGVAQVSLGWSPPADGGSALTGYMLYRTGGPGGPLQQSLGNVTSFTDNGLQNGTTYSYRVSASNAVGEGPQSAVASATPTDLVLPVEPLPALDTFDRANENPLSFGGRWGRGILGAPERSLRVISNQLASDRNSTATGRWNPAQYGPDSEASATVATLPGNGNAFRLYVRLQSPGSSAADGYMLLYTQASGMDQVAIYRMTNGVLTALSSANREVGVGSRLLLRASGTALEAWVRGAAVWTRLSRVNDTTYTSSGFVGVGIRGRTGRLDDFGGR